MNTPNLFDFATSELSQDAFLCWLISWAKPEYPVVNNPLYNCAKDFVLLLLNDQNIQTIDSIVVKKQWHKIDVSVLVNNRYFIVIEDKKGTSEHSNQLQRYEKIAKEYYKDSDIEIKLVYFKLEEQGLQGNIGKSGYFFLGRKEVLNLLGKYIPKANNNILTDFYENIIELDRKIESYKLLPIDKWHWYSWTGFYSELTKHIGGQWEYVPNASGGFLGFYWHWKSSTYNGERFEFYLQLEQEYLIFKLTCNNVSLRKEIRDYFRSKLFTKAVELQVSIEQFGRLGQWMGVAILCKDYRQIDNDKIINIEYTINELQKMEKLIDEVKDIL